MHQIFDYRHRRSSPRKSKENRIIYFTARNISRRLIAVLTIGVGIWTASYMESRTDHKTESIRVSVPPANESGGGASGGREWTSVFRDRNPADYDIGSEVYDCNGESGPALQRCLTERRDAREFVLDRWRSKQRAYVAVHFLCADCDPVHHILIEPDRNGVWRIITMHEDSRFGFSDLGTAFDVRYRRASPYETKREPSPKRLSFLDRSGREINSF